MDDSSDRCEGCTSGNVCTAATDVYVDTEPEWGNQPGNVCAAATDWYVVSGQNEEADGRSCTPPPRDDAKRSKFEGCIALIRSPSSKQAFEVAYSKASPDELDSWRKSFVRETDFQMATQLQASYKGGVVVAAAAAAGGGGATAQVSTPMTAAQGHVHRPAYTSCLYIKNIYIVSIAKDAFFFFCIFVCNT